MEGYVDALALDALPQGSLRSVHVGKDRVLIANDGGQIRAIGAIWTHEHEDLAEVEIEDSCVVCPRHSASFNLETGAVVVDLAAQPDPVSDVGLESGKILTGRKKD
ncbi:MAG: Rieske 2Fe-2S domain-containing protein [Thermaerobacter sp.]|nr:Rieske 2Fe-2S domain-containing protein [Thermaerobacter sp.]